MLRALNKSYLIHADRYSNFLWIYQLKSTTTKAVVEALWGTFYQMGFPTYLRTDNGPQFISQEFINQCKEFSIEQEWSDPHYPTSNGHAERMVGVAKSFIKKANNIENLRMMLQVYNSTPSTETGVSPAEMLMQRKMKTCLPTLNKPKFIPQSTIRTASKKRIENANKTKYYYDKTSSNLRPLERGMKVRVHSEHG